MNLRIYILLISCAFTFNSSYAMRSTLPNSLVLDEELEILAENKQGLTVAQAEELQAQKLLGNNTKQDQQIHDGITRKMKEIVELVHRGIEHFKKNSVEKSCRDFTHNIDWRKGEIFVYVLDELGNILCYGNDFNVIWKNISIARNITSKPLLEQIERAAKAGGWINYIWLNGYQSAYVKETVKNGSKYYLAAGFYPESQEYNTQRLVELAVDEFYDKGIDVLQTDVNNLFGSFVKGEITLSIYDEKGDLIADPEKTGFIGQNLVKILGEAKSTSEIFGDQKLNGWKTYKWKNAEVRTFVHKVVDPKTQKSYFISGSYYPGISQSDMVQFVQKAIAHIKSVGAKDAFSNFNNTAGDYVRGPLNIFVYDYQGKNLANGENPFFVGKNLIDSKDSDGTPIVSKIIELATKYDKGSFTYIDRNAYKTIYFQAIEVPDGKFIVGSGYYPSSKAQAVESMAMKGANYLAQQRTVKALHEFTNTTSEFFRGDISIFVYTPSGTALANGLQTDMIWQNFGELQDMEGQSIMNDILAIAQSGGGWAKYIARNAERRIFVRLVEKIDPVTKQTEAYIIGSGYYA